MQKLTYTLIALFLLVSPNLVNAAETVPVSKSETITESEARAALDKAVAEFHSLSRKEKKSRFREVKAVLRQYRADKKAGLADDADTSQILLAILAILLPPLAIYLKQRDLSWQFWVSAGLLATGLLFLSILPFMWVLSAGLALLVVFDIL